MDWEQFPALEAIPSIRSGFTRRVPSLDVAVEREEALRRMALSHRAAVCHAGLGGCVFATAEQVHGNGVARVDAASTFPVLGTDGLLTTEQGVCLGIYVADCAAVFLADHRGRAIALVHSGKKGTEMGIAPMAVAALGQAANLSPADLVAQISPCIRPPRYEVDFAAEIRRQLAAVGVREIHDSHTCTAAYPERYYSYRREHGLTGRMLAFLSLVEPSP